MEQQIQQNNLEISSKYINKEVVFRQTGLKSSGDDWNSITYFFDALSTRFENAEINRRQYLQGNIELPRQT
jgi:hypothetical protein